MLQFELHQRLAEDCVFIKNLQLCKLLLMNDSNFPWCILVPMRPGISEIHQLEAAEQYELVRESSHLSEVMLEVFQGEKMNVAALGNVVPQLHVHHIVRHSDDSAWPKPVWGHGPAKPYTDEQAQKIRRLLLESV